MKAWSLRSLLSVAVLSSVATAISVSVAAGIAPNVHNITWAVSGLVVLLSVFMLLVDWLSPQPEDRVDIWEYQRQLMSASDQYMPSMPAMTRNSLMYLAITMEELAETTTAMQTALMRKKEYRYGRADTARALGSSATSLQASSKQIKTLLELLEDVDVLLTRQDAIEVFDGVTDLSVTTAGLGLSLGLPVREGYKEVVTSNLSKRDPTTGRILKDPSGKWIKGPNYTPPDLGRVLDAQARATKEL